MKYKIGDTLCIDGLLHEVLGVFGESVYYAVGMIMLEVE